MKVMQHELLLRERFRAATRAFREVAAHRIGDERTALDSARDVLPDAPVVLDIGANVGRWTRQFLELYPRAHVVMIEAQPERMTTLQRLADQHPSVTAVNAVLAEAEGTQDFYVCHGDPQGSGSSLRPELTGAPLERRTVTTTTIDAVVESLSLPSTIDIMKLDAQGSELDILRGATRTLPAVRCMQLEIALIHFNEDGPLLDAVIAFMSEHGLFARDIFDLKYAVGTDHQTHVDCLFSRNIRTIAELGTS